MKINGEYTQKERKKEIKSTVLRFKNHRKVFLILLLFFVYHNNRMQSSLYYCSDLICIRWSQSKWMLIWFRMKNALWLYACWFLNNLKIVNTQTFFPQPPKNSIRYIQRFRAIHNVIRTIITVITWEIRFCILSAGLLTYDVAYYEISSTLNDNCYSLCMVTLFRKCAHFIGKKSIHSLKIVENIAKFL